MASMSGVFVDLAIKSDLPIVPVAFSGGLPVEPLESRAEFPEEVGIGKRISDAAEKRGLLVRPVGNLNVLSPPLTITRAEIDDLVALLRASILDVVENLRDEGHTL